MAVEHAPDTASAVEAERGEAPVEITAPARPAHGRLHALDGLRFLAALSVVGFHFFADYGSRGHWGRPSAQVFGPAVYHVFQYGWLGAECFFVISGFVICMS